LRNKVDLVFSKYLGQDWVFKTEYHIGKNQHHYEETVKRIEREKGSEYLTNRDCIISELMFGYWSFLFSSAYKEILWNKYPEMFGKIFDNSKYTLTLFKAYSQINKIRLYRNKVFHYGSLLTTTEDMMKPEQIHNMIYSMCRSMSAGKLIKYVRAIDSFDEKYQKGKTLGILK
jgi:hypothetical protein